MSEKRKDKKGRVLRTGESQRKDLIYQYRYTDIHGKRQTIYSSDLKELREKEKRIQAWADEGLDYAAGNVTVTELVERYISIKQGVRYNTKVATVYKGNIIKNLIMDCQSYTKYRPNETTGGIFVSWRRKEELPTGA